MESKNEEGSVLLGATEDREQAGRSKYVFVK